LRNWSIVRGGTSSAQKALFFNLRRLRARLNRDAGVSSFDMYERISNTLGVTADDVALMDSRLSAPDTSLNAPLGDETGTSDRQDFLVSSEPLPDEVGSDTIDTERRRQWLEAALAALNERELKIIRERRLRDGGATLEALGSRLGISKERVRQIENRALSKLRAALTEAHAEMDATAAGDPRVSDPARSRPGRRPTAKRRPAGRSAPETVPACEQRPTCARQAKPPWPLRVRSRRGRAAAAGKPSRRRSAA